MSDLLRISIMGQMPNGEEWSVNPVWGLGDFDVPTTPAGVQAVATACAAVAAPAGLASSWAVNTRHDGVRVEARNYAGLLQNQAEAVRAAPIAGTSATTHPFQTAMVLSLRTAAVGQSGRGRLYWPATGLLLDADTYRPLDALVATTLTAYKTFLSGLEAAVKVTYPTSKLVVWSRKLASAANVTQLQAGNILDVQRRRRDTLIESYQSVAFP